MTLTEYENFIRLKTTTRAEAIAAYEDALSAYEAAKAAAIAQTRAKLGNPRWHPFSWVALGIGRPPTHPLSVGF